MRMSTMEVILANNLKAEVTVVASVDVVVAVTPEVDNTTNAMPQPRKLEATSDQVSIFKSILLFIITYYVF